MIPETSANCDIARALTWCYYQIGVEAVALAVDSEAAAPRRVGGGISAMLLRRCLGGASRRRPICGDASAATGCCDVSAATPPPWRRFFGDASAATLPLSRLSNGASASESTWCCNACHRLGVDAVALAAVGRRQRLGGGSAAPRRHLDDAAAATPWRHLEIHPGPRRRLHGDRSFRGDASAAMLLSPLRRLRVRCDASATMPLSQN